MQGFLFCGPSRTPVPTEKAVQFVKNPAVLFTFCRSCDIIQVADLYLLKTEKEQQRNRPLLKKASWAEK